MRKTTITAAALAMSASLAGLAYAAAPDGRSTGNASVVSTFPALESSSTSTAPPPTVASSSPGEQRHGADDGAGHDVGDDHGSGGHGADDGAGHDVGDDHGGDRGGHGAGHDVGDDHSSGGHGSDD